jgi:hypothetical protein
MNLLPLVRNARLYARAETIAAEIRLRLLARKLVLLFMAAAVALFGLALVNLALFNAIEIAWGPVWTPLLLGAVNLVLAALVFLLAVLRRPGPELAVAEDLRKAAGAAFEDQFRAGPGLSANASHLLIPVIGLIAGALRRKKTTVK